MSDSETDTEHTGGGPTRRRQTRTKSGDKLTRSLPPLEASLDGSITHICNEVQLRLIDEQLGKAEKKRLWLMGYLVTDQYITCDNLGLHMWQNVTINGDIILNIPLTFKFEFSIDEVEFFFSQPDFQLKKELATTWSRHQAAELPPAPVESTLPTARVLLLLVLVMEAWWNRYNFNLS